ncbi:MAG: sensor histidine kinase [Bdellovibrio sp.]
MASGITHEIANPAGIISLSAAHLKSYLENQQLDKVKAVELLDLIETMSSRISKIDASMRLATRNFGNDTIELVSIKSLIAETVGISRDKLAAEKIELRIKNLEFINEDKIIKCRKSQITQALLNLIHNSRDAVTKLKEKWVEVKVEIKNELLIITITDSGKGIDKTIVPKMMTPFFTTKSKDQSAGLGLSISAEIIKEHCGKLYYSPNTQNTTFTVELPISCCDRVKPVF